MRRFVWLAALCAPAALWAAGAGEEYAVADFTPTGWGPFLTEAARSVDITGFILVTLLVAVLGMGLDLFNHLRLVKIFPDVLLAELQDEMSNGEYEKALELCEKSDSLVGEVFSAALSKTDYSFERMREAMRGEMELQALVWRQWVRQFRIIAFAGPLAGALGAVVNAMRFVADLNGRPDIGLAVASSFEVRSLLHNVLTALGLGMAIALAALAVFAVASSKLEKVLLEAARLGEELLDPFRPLPLPQEE